MRLTSLRALQAKELVETAYNASGGLPVYLAGHSNGPLYALALLNSTTPQWRQQHIGEHLLLGFFEPISKCFPGPLASR